METYIGCSIIINNDKKILISKRSQIKKSYAGMWETIGGALENNK